MSIRDYAVGAAVPAVRDITQPECFDGESVRIGYAVLDAAIPVLLAPLRKLVDEVRGHSEVESEPAEYRTREGSWKDTADTLEHILDQIEGKDA